MCWLTREGAYLKAWLRGEGGGLISLERGFSRACAVRSFTSYQALLSILDKTKIPSTKNRLTLHLVC